MNRLILITSLTAILACSTTSFAQQLSYQQQQQLQKAEQMAGQAAELHKNGNAVGAAKLIKNAVAIFEQTLGTTHEQTVFHFYIAGVLLSDAQQFQDSNRFLQKAYDSMVKSGQTDKGPFLKTLQYLASGYMSVGDFENAESYGRKLVDVTKQQHGVNHPETAMAYHALSRIAMEQQKYDVAKQHSRQALKINQQVYGLDHEATLHATTNLAYITFDAGSRTGDLSEAKTHYLNALNILNRTKSEMDKTRLDVLPWLAMIASREGDLDTTKKYLRQAIKISKATNGDTKFFRRLLADTNYEAGDKKQAVAEYKQLLSLMRKSPGTEHQDTAALLDDLGLKLFWAGAYGESRKYLEEALNIRKKVLGKNHRDTAESIFNWSGLLGKQGDLQGSLDGQLQALEIRKAVFPEGHPVIASSLEAVGGAYQALQQYEKATPYFQQAFKIFKNHFGPEHPRTAETEKNYGVHLSNIGRLDEAAEYLERSVLHIEKLYVEKDWTTASSLEDLAYVYVEMGRLDDARSKYNRALSIRENLQGTESPFAIDLIARLANLDYRQDKISDAIVKFDQYTRRSKNFFLGVLPSLNEQEQLRFLEHAQRDQFQNLVSFIGYDSSDRELIEKVLSWVINGKNIRFDSLANRQQLNKLSESNQKVRSLYEQLSNVRQQLSAMTLASQPGTQSELSELRKKENELSRQLQVLAGDKLPVTESWIGLDRVRNKIPKNGALIEIVRNWAYDFESGSGHLGSHYFAWIVPDTGPVEFLDLGNADEIDREIEIVMKDLRSVADNAKFEQLGEKEATAEISTALAILSNRIWKPIGDKLSDDVAELIISPDGPLWLLPWSALRTVDDRYLLEDYILHFAVSGRELVKANSEANDSKRSFIFADPDYDLSETATRKAIKAMFPNKPMDYKATRSGSRTRLNSVARLPSTKSEADAVAPSIETIVGKKPQAYTGKWALETVLKEVKQPNYLLLSTHGYFLSKAADLTPPKKFMGTRSGLFGNLNTGEIENPLLRCGLLLAGCNSGNLVAGDDGIFTGLEVASLNLAGTEMVVLSACETAVGDIRTGEGVVGLRQAFQSAGAESVVATLWQVPDRDSAIIMSDFFKNLASGQSRAEALREAQLKRIASRRERNGAAHPFFWAAWTLTGFSEPSMNATSTARRENPAAEYASLLSKAQKGNAQAQYEIGMRYLKGIDVEQDKAESVVWFRESAEQGNSLASQNLGLALLQGEGVEKDVNEALKWLALAANKDRRLAQYHLGNMYRDGIGVEKDLDVAAQWYDKAADGGNKEAKKALAGLSPNLILELIARADTGDTAAQLEIGNKLTHGESVAQDLERGLFYLELAANNGNSEAAWRAGMIYKNRKDKDLKKAFDYALKSADMSDSTGLSVFSRIEDESEQEVFEWVKSAAENNSPYAQYRLGQHLVSGEVAEKDLKAAFEWFKKSAAVGYPASNYAVGTMLQRGSGVSENKTEAISWIRKAAEQDYAKAIYAMGDIYYFGKGTVKDYRKAAHWYQMGADQEHIDSMNDLAYMYEKGRGVKQDYKKAMELYVRSASKGDASAQKDVGDLYRWGNGVHKNYAQALDWYKKAASQNDTSAFEAIGDIYRIGGSGIAQDLGRAVSWYQKAADEGIDTAQFELGRCYLTGSGVGEDYKQAFHWMQKSADQGYARAQLILGYMYSNGDGVEEDQATAIHWYRKAAEQGYADAQCQLGRCYINGTGVEANDLAASKWFEKAAAQDDSQGQFLLAILYLEGRGKPKDERKAIEYLEKSAAQGNEDAKSVLQKLK